MDVWSIRLAGRRSARRPVPSISRALLSTLILVGLLPGLAQADEGLRKLDAGLELKEQNGRFPTGFTGAFQLVVDTPARRGYGIFSLSGGTLVRPFDIDSLRPVADGDLRIDEKVLPGSVKLDESGRRILLPFGDRIRDSLPFSFKGVVVVDVGDDNLGVLARWPAPVGAVVSGTTAMPILAGTYYYSPPGGRPKLLLLYEEAIWDQAIVPKLINNLVFVAQWDAESGQQDWAYRLGACRGKLPPGMQEFFRDEQSVYVGCVTQQNTGLAVRVILGPEGRPSGEEAFPGPPLMQRIIADPGGGRLGFVAEQNFQESIFIFDAGRSAYVGAIATTNENQSVGYAIDGASGRLFVSSKDKGVMLGDLRRTPAQQALVFSHFSRTGGGKPDISVERASAAGPRRFYVRESGQGTVEIYVDEINVSSDPAISELDRFTVDREEAEGVTGSNFEVGSHGYGLRVLTPGGIEGAPPETARSLLRKVGSPCTKSNREMVLGLITQATLSRGNAAASTIAADSDPGTKNDLANPVTRCWPFPDPFETKSGLGDDWPRPGKKIVCPGGPNPQCEALLTENADEFWSTADSATRQDWPFERLECSGDENPEALRTESPFSGYRVEVACAGASGRASATSIARAEDGAFEFGVGNDSLVRVAEGGATTDLEQLSGGGVLVSSRAWARGIEITGVGYIRSVETISSARAAGRSGSARGEFERKICGVITSDYRQEGCSSYEQAVDALNRSLSGRGRVILRQPDAELKLGSPGGFVASVQKDRFEELSDRALNGDPATQVTGLEIMFINDSLNYGGARQIFQFAGVDASTTYGIYLLPPEEELPILTSPLSFPDSPVSDLTGLVGRSGDSIPPAASPMAPPRRPSVLEKIRDGLALALRSPEEALLAAIMWATMGIPLYLAVRRRKLARRLAAGA